MHPLLDLLFQFYLLVVATVVGCVSRGYLRPRKLESAMLNSHEVSGYHQTALERMNESNLSGGDQSNDGHNGLPEIAVMSDLL